MEREWLPEAEQGEAALEAEAPAERPSMLSRLASWRAPAAEAPTGRNLFCTACGAPVQGPFCGGCGLRAA